MTGILGQLKWESFKKRRKDNRLILLYKGLNGKASVTIDDLIPKTRRCRNQHSMAFQTPMFIKVASSPKLSGIGMSSPILWSHLLKMQRIVLLSSLLWWELGTNSLITGPGEWLSFRRFTSKLSWSWSSLFSFSFLDFQLQNDMCIAKTEISWTRIFIVWFKKEWVLG